MVNLRSELAGYFFQSFVLVVCCLVIQHGKNLLISKDMLIKSNSKTKPFHVKTVGVSELITLLWSRFFKEAKGLFFRDFLEI